MFEKISPLKNNEVINFIIVAATYLLLAYAGEFLFEPTLKYFTIRLAPGFGLVAALTYGLPAIFGVFLGEFIYLYFLHTSELTVPVLFALAANAALYVYIGVRLIQRYVEHPDYLTNTLDCYKLFILGGFVASLIPSLLAVYCISLNDPDVQILFWPLSAHWWLAQGLGVLVISPIVLCVFHKLKPIWLTRIPLIPVSLTVLLVFMGIIYAYVSAQEKEKLESTLEQKALTISTLLKLQIAAYAEELYRISSLFEYSFDIDPVEFEAFSKSIKNRQPSVHAISYQQLVKADGRDFYENKMRKIYSNKFEITERDSSGEFTRAGEREEYTPITMRAIYDKNARIMGFDTLTSIYSKSAREQARETNKLVISRPFSLASNKSNNKSIVLILPLYKNDYFSGFVSLSVYANKAVQSTFKYMYIGEFPLKIWDATSPESDHIYSENIVNYEENSDLSKEGRIRFKSLNWRYRILPDLSYFKNLITSQILVITFCILLVIILSVRLLVYTGKKYEFDRLFSESKERNRLLLDSTAEAIYGIDLKGECTFVNRACLQMLEYQSENDLIGKNMHKLLRHTRNDGTPSLNDGVPYPIEECKIHQSPKEGTHVDDEVLWRADDSYFHSECRSFPILINEKIIGTVVSFTDITKRVNAKALEVARFKTLTRVKNALALVNKKLVNTQEELKLEQERTEELLEKRTSELRETQIQLFQAEKMDTIGMLSSGIAHEVKNPLAVIQLGINYLQKTLQGDESIDDIIQDMDSAVYRADSVIKELVNFSASKQLKLEKQNLNPIINESLLLVKHELAKNNINVEKKLKVNLPLVELDQNKLQQVFINLFMNAISAMGTKGTLRIRSYKAAIENVLGEHDLDISGQFRLTKNVVIIEIEDTGSGIKPEDKNKIFEPFFTTKNAGVGTGLGLTVTENIVRLHNAHIEIKNRKEKGAIASLIFKAN